MKLHMVDGNLVEEGNPADDARLFRRCMGLFATGVAIITTRHEGQSAGATVNSVASVSLDPPLVLWSIARTSRSFDIFQKADGFVINILSKEQMDLSRHFSGTATDKFLDVATTPGLDGIPAIDGALAQIECRNEISHDGGDHVIKIGRAIKVRSFEGEPLMFVKGRYAVPADHPDVRPRPEVPQSNGASETLQKRSVISLIFKAHHLLSQKFDAHRRAEGTHLSVTRIMDVLEATPGMTFPALLEKTFLGTRDAEDALVEMQTQGLIARDGDVYRLNEKGRALRLEIGARWLQFEAEELSKLTPNEIAQATELLARLTAR
jgi:flavin reductase (DIM6/NTAB) family NADH-FMN oxidoreductase RutF/DNA-binding MarR family transcriptional regulator